MEDNRWRGEIPFSQKRFRSIFQINLPSENMTQIFLTIEKSSFNAMAIQEIIMNLQGVLGLSEPR
jgi:hypothetical protein